MVAVENERGKTLERSFNEKVKVRGRVYGTLPPPTPVSNVICCSSQLFSKRSVGILLYICLLLISWATIIYLKAQSQQVAEQLSSYIEVRDEVLATG